MTAGDPLYIEAHLGYIFDKALHTDAVIVTSEAAPRGWCSACYSVNELDKAARHLAARSDAGANVFVRNNLLAERIYSYRRGTKAQTGWVTTFAGDVDIAGIGHQPAADGLPLPNRGQAEAICHTLLTPSYIVFSGGGFYPFWRLTEAWDVRDPETRAEYLALERAWGRSLTEVGRRAGYHVDMVGDGTRILRSAGTVNHKPGRDPWPVVVHLGSAFGGGDYTIDQIRQACIVDSDGTRHTTPRLARRVGEATVWDTFASLYTLHDVLDQDHRFGPWKCVDNRGGYDLWRRADATSDYSIKQAHDTGVVIVWSSVVAAALDVSPGEGLDLFGFACKLEGVDPRRKAADIMRLAPLQAEGGGVMIDDDTIADALALELLDDPFGASSDGRQYDDQDPYVDVPTPGDEDAPHQPLTLQWISELAREVDNAPLPAYLAQPVIVAGDYGVFGAEKKAGKTWVSNDLAVNTAAGGRWLGLFPIDRPGPVLYFAGEGGQRKIVRRLRAVADFYGFTAETLPIKICVRAPKLTRSDHLEVILDELRSTGAVLVIIDPAYLATTGAITSNLVEMGGLLERIQHVAQACGATLLLTHHWNKTGTSRGADRFTGSGYAEWGRFLMSMAVLSKHTDSVTNASSVVLKLEITGDEQPDTEITLRRTVRADDPDNLTSPLHYELEQVDNDVIPAGDEPAAVGLRPSALRVLEVLRGRDGWTGQHEIGDRLADTGHPLKKRTILDALTALVERGLVDRLGVAAGESGAWRVCIADPDRGGEK